MSNIICLQVPYNMGIIVDLVYNQPGMKYEHNSATNKSLNMAPVDRYDPF